MASLLKKLLYPGVDQPNLVNNEMVRHAGMKDVCITAGNVIHTAISNCTTRMGYLPGMKQNSLLF